MAIIIIAVFLLIILARPEGRYIVFHPITSIVWAFKDIYGYIAHKEYNVCREYGKIKMYSASDAQAFGCGKSLSMAHYCGYLNKRYNHKKVWDSKEKKFVEQHLFFVSNLELKNVDYYIPFVGKSQFQEVEKLGASEHDIVFFVLDEAGIVFNSRQYKDNIPTEFLARLLQIRHNKVGFILNAQRFGMVDKVIRETCSVVTTCKKIWRIVILQDFDAFNMENAVNPTLIQPLRTTVWFAKNEDFDAYDTNYNVTQLNKDLEDGDILTTEEILAQVGEQGNLERVTKLRHKYRHPYKRR